MIKFRSVGYRNVSVWGFFGLLSFAAFVSITSVKTEEQELWLVVAVRGLLVALGWALWKLKDLPWRALCARVAAFDQWSLRRSRSPAV